MVRSAWGLDTILFHSSWKILYSQLLAHHVSSLLAVLVFRDVHELPVIVFSPIQTNVWCFLALPPSLAGAHSETPPWYKGGEGAAGAEKHWISVWTKPQKQTWHRSLDQWFVSISTRVSKHWCSVSWSFVSMQWRIKNVIRPCGWNDKSHLHAGLTPAQL